MDELDSQPNRIFKILEIEIIYPYDELPYFKVYLYLSV